MNFDYFLDKANRDNYRINVINLFKDEIFCYHPKCDFILVSNYGRIKNSITNKCYKQHKNNNGYLCVNIKYSCGKRMSTMVHRLVLDTFLCHFDKEHIFEVNHINGNKTDNCLSNLEWMTRYENLQHARDNKLFKGLKGEKHPNCKVFKKDIEDIRELHKLGFKIKNIAKELNLDRNTISAIINRKGRYKNE